MHKKHERDQAPRVAVSVENLVVSESGHEILHGVSLDIDKGDFLIITGASGSGKSTLLRTIGGVQPPASGAVAIDGVDLYTGSERARNKIVRDKIGNGFQRPNTDTNLTLRQNLAGLAKMKDRYSLERMTRIAYELGLASLDPVVDKMDRRVATLSGGEQQRANIARLLVSCTGLILLDEPTSALDTKTSTEVYEYLGTVAQERALTIVAVTHDAEQARSFATREVVMADGQIVDQLHLSHTQLI